MSFFSDLKNKITGKKEKDTYLDVFSKTSNSFRAKLDSLSAKQLKPKELKEEILTLLIEADLGYKASENIAERFYYKTTDYLFLNKQQIYDILLETLKEAYEVKVDTPLNINNFGPTVNLIVGVNGSGKTTTIAKMANIYLKQGKTVLLAAGDTFRAGASEQLAKWANELGCQIVIGKENQDPASVLVDACIKAKNENIDYVICDTAGRLQNKANLMQELEKIYRVLNKYIENSPHNSFLVIDGNTGQNGLSQAELFNEVAKLNGVILTKIDGTSKGGIILAIKNIFGIPVRYLTFGENINDIKEFDLDLYLYSLLGERDE